MSNVKLIAAICVFIEIINKQTNHFLQVLILI